MDEAVDPSGPERGSLRLLRGSGWDNDETYCRTAFRRTLSPSFRANGVGFRIALSPSSQLAEPAEFGYRFRYAFPLFVPTYKFPLATTTFP